MPDKHALILQPGIGLGAACYNKTGIVYYHAGFEKSLIYFSIQALETKIIKASRVICTVIATLHIISVCFRCL